MGYLIGIIIWLALSYVAYKEGQRREIGGMIAGLLSVLLSPIVGLLLVAISRPLPVVDTVERSDEQNSIIANKIQELQDKKERGFITPLEYHEQL